MAKIRNGDLARLAAEVLPERSVLSALPAVTGASLPVASGGVTQNLPVLGGGAAAGTVTGGPGGVANQALASAFAAGTGTVTPLSS